MIHSAPQKIPFQPLAFLCEIRDAAGRYLGATDWLPAVDRFVLVNHHRGPFLVTSRFGRHPEVAAVMIRGGLEFSMSIERWIYWFDRETGRVRWCKPEAFPGILPDWLAGPLRRAAARRLEVDFE